MSGQEITTNRTAKSAGSRRTRGKVAKRKTATAGVSCHEGRDVGISTDHPDHRSNLVRIRRVQGQIAGIERMVSGRRYCMDILIQFRAAISALKAVEAEIFKKHVWNCVRAAMESRDEAEIGRKIDEITKIILKS